MPRAGDSGSRVKRALVTVALLVTSPVLLVFTVFWPQSRSWPSLLVASVAPLGAERTATTATPPVRAASRGSVIPLRSVGATSCD